MGYRLNSEAYVLFAQIEVGVREFLIQLINEMGIREWTVTFLGRTHLESLKEIGKRIHEAKEKTLLYIPLMVTPHSGDGNPPIERPGSERTFRCI